MTPKKKLMEMLMADENEQKKKETNLVSVDLITRTLFCSDISLNFSCAFDRFFEFMLIS